MRIAGIGCRRGVLAEDVLAAIALARLDLDDTPLEALATIAAKADEYGLRDAARRLGLEVLVPSGEALANAAGRVATHSGRVLQITGLPSVAEAAALAAAGPQSLLVAHRVAVGGATCAVAEAPGDEGSR